MALVTAPLLSIQAAGKFGNTLIYERSKGRCYVKPYKAPTVRRFPAQRAVRAITKFLTESWKNGSDIVKADWEAAAEPLGISGINLFCKRNFQRLWSGFSPCFSLSPVDADNSYSSAFSTVAGGAGIVSGGAFIVDDVTDGLICVTLDSIQYHPLLHFYAVLFRVPGNFVPADFSILNVSPGVYYAQPWAADITGGKIVGANFPEQVTVT
jgi:hypothetical protein